MTHVMVCPDCKEELACWCERCHYCEDVTVAYEDYFDEEDDE